MRELIQGLYSPEWVGRPPQGPRCLFITCSDLPIDPLRLVRPGPGELRVLSNAGNIVPPHQAEGDARASTIEAAAADPLVRDVIVCGHSPCLVLKRLLRPGLLSDLPAVADWLRHADAARRPGMDGLRSPDERRALFAFAAANVLAQLENLRTLPGVATRLAVGRLALRGWVYERDTGAVFCHAPLAGTFVPMAEPAPPDA